MNRLLNESWIEGLPDNIVDNLEALNRYVVLRLCERIKEIGDIGTSDSHRLMSVIGPERHREGNSPHYGYEPERGTAAV